MKKITVLLVVLLLAVSSLAQARMYKVPDQIEPDLIIEDDLAAGPSVQEDKAVKDGSGSSWWKWGLGILAVGAIGAAAGGGGGSSTSPGTGDTGSGTVTW